MYITGNTWALELVHACVLKLWPMDAPHESPGELRKTLGSSAGPPESRSRECQGLR